MNAQEESAFVEAMRAVFGESSSQFGEPLVEMLREFWLIARPKRCRWFFIPGVLVSPDGPPLVREQCTFPNGHEGPHSFARETGVLAVELVTPYETEAKRFAIVTLVSNPDLVASPTDGPRELLHLRRDLLDMLASPTDGHE